MKELFRHRASEQSNFIGAQNKTVGIKTNISNDSSAGARGIEFMPLIEQLDLYDGLAPGNNNQQSDGGANGPSETSEYYGAREACLVTNRYKQPNNSSIRRWVVARSHVANYSSPTKEDKQKQCVEDNL